MERRENGPVQTGDIPYQTGITVRANLILSAIIIVTDDRPIY